jgi:hypothetical protein
MPFLACNIGIYSLFGTFHVVLAIFHRYIRYIYNISTISLCSYLQTRAPRPEVADFFSSAHVKDGQKKGDHPIGHRQVRPG